ncbi:hypothetical protein QQF64_023678 [Cirrhinus molitorella]|uniref:Uncharacterized protein n=1 Tax=Cirrhinus molitorella TaxID=172907 RepID=A0ABR3NJ28_9TELE
MDCAHCDVFAGLLREYLFYQRGDEYLFYQSCNIRVASLMGIATYSQQWMEQLTALEGRVPPDVGPTLQLKAGNTCCPKKARNIQLKWNQASGALPGYASGSLMYAADTAGLMDVTDPAGRNRWTKRWNYKAGSKKVSVSPSVRLAHAQTLLSNTAKYPIDRVCLKNFSIPEGSRVSNQENRILGMLPKSIFLSMVDNDAFTGTYTKNPFIFNNYDLEFLAVYVKCQQFPAKPLQPNFESRSAVREFYQLSYRSSGLGTSDSKHASKKPCHILLI